jgi:chemotaxis protein MotB
MAAKKPKSGSDIPEWLVTFADLMSILVCFFVLIISFSIQDQQKLQVVAGSMKDAFGILAVSKKSGVIEREGNPERKHLRQVTIEETQKDRDFATIDHSEKQKQGPEANTHDIESNEIEKPRQFALAAASLKQAFSESPDITNVADNLIVQEIEEGTHVIIADQKGRSMFPDGSKYPYEITRKALAAMAPLLAQMPNRIRITGHTASGMDFPNPRYGKWELSADRANVVRATLEEFGVPADQIFSVVGRGDAEPFFPNDPYLATNQRVSILLVAEEPPVPVELKP